MSIDFKPDVGDYVLGKGHCRLFDRDIEIITKAGCEEYAEGCLAAFNNMSEELINKLKLYTLRYCEDFRQFFDSDSPEVPQGVTEEDIFNYVVPNAMMVKKPKVPERLAFSVELSCKWEREHGVEWVINDGEVLYVGDFVDISPWYSPDVYRREVMNYVFHEKCI